MVRKQITYKGYTIQYYQELFKSWSSVVVELRGTDNAIHRAGTSPALVISRAKQSIDTLLIQTNPLAEIHYRGYIFVYSYDCPKGASYFIYTSDRLLLATVNDMDVGRALKKAKLVIDGIKDRVKAEIEGVDAMQVWLNQ